MNLQEISIIVCSINPELAKNLSQNIHETIGINSYELIIFDNRNEKLSITEVYNNQAALAKNDLLLFIHEDCVFITRSWGQILLNHFNSGVGAIGLAGSKIKYNAPSYWSCSDLEFHVKHIYQNGNLESLGFGSSDLEEVVLLDGVFLSCIREKSGNLFNNIQGFHGYDMDFSLNMIGKGKKLFVTNKIEVNHLSKGNKNCEWMNSLFTVNKIHSKKLPVSVDEQQLNKINSNSIIEKNFHLACDLKCKKPALEFYALYNFNSLSKKLIWIKRIVQLYLNF